MPTVLLRSEESGGAVSAIETVAPAGFGGPPLHHHDFDEAFYVLEGELTFQLEDRRFTAGPGELAFAPRNVPHTYANLSGAAARVLIVCTPAGFERYFARMEAKQAGVDPPEWARAGWPEVTKVGPPIGGPLAPLPDIFRSRRHPLVDGAETAHVSPCSRQGPPRPPASPPPLPSRS